MPEVTSQEEEAITALKLQSSKLLISIEPSGFALSTKKYFLSLTRLSNTVTEAFPSIRQSLKGSNMM